MGGTLPRGSEEGGWFGGGGDMRNSDIEHGCAIYCDADASGYVLGDGARARTMDIKVAVVEGGDKLGWYTEGGGKGSRYGGGG